MNLQLRPITAAPQREQAWLWESWIPNEVLAIVEADPGSSKSTFALALAAAVTRGRQLCGQPTDGPGAVWIANTEDEGHVMRARLQAAGADLDLVQMLGNSAHPARFPDDLGDLESLLATTQPRLLILDPLSELIANIGQEHSVRRSFVRLLQLARQHRFAVLGVRHLTKGSRGNALHQGLGSIGVSGIARSVMGLAADPAEPSRRVLFSKKSSYGRPPPPQLFSVSEAEGAVRLDWVGPSDVPIEQLLGIPAASDRSALAEAMRFLASALGDGALHVKEVEQLARQNGIAPRTLRRARERLGVIFHRRGFGQGSEVWWQLPEDGTVLRMVRAEMLDELADQLTTGDAAFQPAPAGRRPPPRSGDDDVDDAERSKRPT